MRRQGRPQEAATEGSSGTPQQQDERRQDTERKSEVKKERRPKEERPAPKQEVEWRPRERNQLERDQLAAFSAVTRVAAPQRQHQGSKDAMRPTPRQSAVRRVERSPQESEGTK